MRFSTVTKILIASTLALAPLLHTAASAQSASTTEIPKTEIVAFSRSVTSTRLFVSYRVNARLFTMIGDRSNPDETRVDIVEGSRLLVRTNVDRNGNVTLTNHLGRTYSAAQLTANPTLFGTFDFEALVGLDPSAMGYLVTGQGTSANPCVLNPWVGLCCLAGGAIAAGFTYFVGTCEPYLHCGPYGCSGGFNCGE